MRTRLTSIVGVLVALTGTGMAGAAVICSDSGLGYVACVINNGSAPPDPENVIDDETYAGPERTYVRNQGCPDGWGDEWVLADDACVSPGEPTEIEVVDGGLVDSLRVRDSSIVTMNGGTVRWPLRVYDSSVARMIAGSVLQLWAYDSADVTVSGGTIASDLDAYDFSSVTVEGGTVEGDLSAEDTCNVTMSGGTVVGSLTSSGSPTVAFDAGWVSQVWAAGASSLTMNGGTVWTHLTAYDSATVTIRGGGLGGAIHAAVDSAILIEGRSFSVDGAPVQYGDLDAQTGVLTGTLASGDPLDNYFYQGQGDGGYYSRTITLMEAAPEPIVAALESSVLVVLGALRRRSRSMTSAIQGRREPRPR